MPAIIYKKIEDKINKAKFETRIPEYYDPAFPKYFKDYELDPFFNPASNNECISMLSIKHIIDMCFNEIPFKIVKESDFYLIIEYLEEYLKVTAPYRINNPEFSQFFERCQNTLSILKEEDNRKLAVADYRNMQAGRPLTLQELLERIVK
jgi:hypothetical protein